MGMTDTRAVEGYAGYSGRLHVCAACIIIYDRVTGDIDFRAARKNDVEKTATWKSQPPCSSILSSR